MSAYGITRKWAFLRLTFVLVIGGLGHDQASAAKINRDVPKATPSIDGTITAEEMSSQLAIPMVWPVTNGAIVLDGSGHGVDDISATWYVSWNEQSLNISAVVRDSTPDFRLSSGGTGNVPYNGQDVIQLVFNPHNDQSNMFVDPNGDPGTAAIYDMVVDTSDEFGPDIYRHGPQLTTDQRASIAIDGQITATGYILEAAIPWAVAGEKLNVLKAGCVEPFVPDDLADAGAVRIDCVVLNRHDPSASFMPGWDRDPGRQPQTAPPSSLMIGSCRMIRLGRHRLGPGAKGRTSHTR